MITLYRIVNHKSVTSYILDRAALFVAAVVVSVVLSTLMAAQY